MRIWVLGAAIAIRCCDGSGGGAPGEVIAPSALLTVTRHTTVNTHGLSKREHPGLKSEWFTADAAMPSTAGFEAAVHEQRWHTRVLQVGGEEGIPKAILFFLSIVQRDYSRLSSPARTAYPWR